MHFYVTDIGMCIMICYIILILKNCNRQNNHTFVFFLAYPVKLKCFSRDIKRIDTTVSMVQKYYNLQIYIVILPTLICILNENVLSHSYKLTDCYLTVYSKLMSVIALLKYAHSQELSRIMDHTVGKICIARTGMSSYHMFLCTVL